MSTPCIPSLWIYLSLALAVGCATDSANDSADGDGPAITTRILEPAFEGALYGQGLSLEGGVAPYVWSVADPGPYGEWLEIEGGSGKLKGTPTVQKASSPITVSVTDSQDRTATRTLELSVGPCADGVERRCAVPDGLACKVGKATCRDGTFGACSDLEFPQTQTEACGADCKPCGGGADRCVVGQCQCGIDGATCEGVKGCCLDADRSNPTGRRCADFKTDVEACGSCNIACRRDLQHTVRSCSAGQCQYNCEVGWKRCNVDPANLNCATHTDVDIQNCGSCGKVCGGPLTHASPSCAGGRCEAQCEPGWGSCGLNYGVGCPFDLMNSPHHCGSCANTCYSLPNVAEPICVNGGCGVGTCKPGFGNCNGIAADGCETNLMTNTEHCAACGNNCNVEPFDFERKCSGGYCVR